MKPHSGLLASNPALCSLTVNKPQPEPQFLISRGTEASQHKAEHNVWATCLTQHNSFCVESMESRKTCEQEGVALVLGKEDPGSRQGVAGSHAGQFQHQAGQGHCGTARWRQACAFTQSRIPHRLGLKVSGLPCSVMRLAPL